MQYGMPRNFRAPRAREDNKGGPTKKKFGMKKFGLRLKTNRKHLWSRRLTWTHWYKKEVDRDEAYKHYVNQKQWFDQNKPEYKTVEKIER